MKWKWLSCVRLFATPWTILSMEISRPEYWRGLPFLFQGIFPTQGSNPGLLHCRRILYQLSYKGSPACHVAWSKKYTYVQFKIKKNLDVAVSSISAWTVQRLTGPGCDMNEVDREGLNEAETRLEVGAVWGIWNVWLTIQALLKAARNGDFGEKREMT